MSTALSRTIHGIAGSPGVAVGPVLVLSASRMQYVRRHVSNAEIDFEIARVRAAVEGARSTLRGLTEQMPASFRETSPILEAYLLMVGDPTMLDRIDGKIRTLRICAEWAVFESCSELSHMLMTAAEGHAYLKERTHDIEFVGDLLLRSLRGENPLPPLQIEEPMIVIGRDLSAADTAGMAKEPVLAFVTEVGSRTSHTSIVARALEIPAVVGAPDLLDHVRTGDVVIVDGLTGKVIVRPTEAEVEDAKRRSAQHRAYARSLFAGRDRLASTSCGARVSLRANVELNSEATLAIEHGAEGIGLYRTEFLYIDRATIPTEEEQYVLYRDALLAAGEHPVTLRTFDLGGDKFASSFQLPSELNPALGLRAVRLALRQPKIFLTQLRAMVRASVHGHLRIMVPMVTTIHEMRQVRELLRLAREQVVAAGQAAAPDIPLGMMIEVPSAAIMADAFAKEADFFSLGTNDLVQYGLAVDRASRALAVLASPFDPAILRLIRMSHHAAVGASIPISICGAMASDPLGAILLVGLGLRDLSMEAAAILEVKEALARVTLLDAEQAAEEALSLESAEAVEDHLARLFAPRLADLLTQLSDAV